MQIEGAIVAGESLRKTAASFGVSFSSVRRHVDAHLKRDVQAVVAREEAAQELVAGKAEAAYSRATSALDRLFQLNGETQACLEQAKQARDVRLQLQAIGMASRLLELQAKLRGELGDGGTTVNITHNDFRTLQVNIVQALSPYPEAREAVLRALAGGG